MKPNGKSNEVSMRHINEMKMEDGNMFELIFKKNTFDNFKTKNIILLQSMFAVTFTANRDSRWLYEILQFLFNHIEELNQAEFASLFKEFLEKMAVRYAEERLFTEDKKYQKIWGNSCLCFNFVDYVLWKIVKN